MKKSILLISTLLSISSFASCEKETYTLVINDYDSVINESCEAFVEAAMKLKGCSEDEFTKHHFQNVQSIKEGSSYMCILETDNGIYQVMASQMAEPNIASILYSRYD